MARDDVSTDRSDQCWPEHSTAIAFGTPLGGFLRGVRHLADRHAETYQFVRLYEPVHVVASPEGLVAPVAASPLLSVVVTSNATATLRSALDALAATDDATDDDVSIEVVADAELLRAAGAPLDPARIVAVDLRRAPTAGRGHLDRLVDAARGGYVVFLHGDVAVDRRWVDAMGAAAESSPGSVLAAGPPVTSVTVALPGAVVRGLALGDVWSDRHAAALVDALTPLCGVAPVDVPDGAVVTAAAPASDARPDEPCGDVPTWSVPTLVDPAATIERDALRRRVDELDRWAASLAADNDVLNAELGRLPVRIVRRLSAVGRTIVRTVARR